MWVWSMYIKPCNLCVSCESSSNKNDDYCISILEPYRAGGIAMNEKKNFASEILSDLNRSVSRWRFAFISMAIIEFITIAFFLIREV